MSVVVGVSAGSGPAALGAGVEVVSRWGGGRRGGGGGGSSGGGAVGWRGRLWCCRNAHAVRNVPRNKRQLPIVASESSSGPAAHQRTVACSCQAAAVTRRLKPPMIDARR